MGVEIIAEVAQGYEGNQTIAALLAKASIYCGADAVKFQLVYADDTATPDYKYYDLYRNLEMSLDVWKEITSEIKKAGRKLYFDVGGQRALNEAIALQADGVKIHATNFYNSELIRGALHNMPRVFLSLGGISAEELEKFIDYHHIVSRDQICLIYGFQAEPTPLEANNLLRISSLRNRFSGFPIGFMDHIDGACEDSHHLALMALPLGIQFLEKHISLDRSLELEDNISALTPSEFKVFVSRIKRLEAALGSENLELNELEKEYRRKVLKVVVARQGINKGEVLTPGMLALKRVSIIREPLLYRKEEAIGKALKQDVRENQQITGEMLV